MIEVVYTCDDCGAQAFAKIYDIAEPIRRHAPLTWFIHARKNKATQTLCSQCRRSLRSAPGA